MLKINHFWRSIKMSWLRRLSFSKSTWANLHKAETRPYTYDPITANWNDLEIARNKISNLVWRDVYDSLMTCRKNVVHVQPLEYLTFPVNGEPSITKNNNSVKQP